ncbi:MAG: glycosyltransferase, partial [Porphyromonadaceae bacterium]|nr:glycosyltransferase [Porphyromonadaceae bacterium]
NLFDLFYFPSLTEGQPNSLIEAEVVGLPILASNINPIKEAVPESMFPKLIPPKDISQAVSAIEKLYRDPELRKEYVCDKWSKKKFDGKLRFEEFLREIDEK